MKSRAFTIVGRIVDSVITGRAIGKGIGKLAGGNPTARPLLRSLLLLGALSGIGCGSLVKFTDTSIPRLVTPISSASTEELSARLAPFVGLQSLRAWSVYLRFDDLESAERYREAEAILVLKRPDKIRLVIQVPVVKTKIAEMASEDNRFRVAIYPTDFRSFLTGTNTADYSTWRGRLGEKGRSALVSARPFHFTDALLIAPLRKDDPRFVYSVEETLVEAIEAVPGSRKAVRVLRSHYVISEVEVAGPENGPARVRRKFWFDRTAGCAFTRQQIFDQQGEMATEVGYSNFRRLRATDTALWPGTILVSRPHDNYQARLTFTEERFETNIDLPPNAFLLENTEGLPVTDLDKPIASLRRDHRL